MKYDLKKPCKNCPFRTDDTGIKFQCTERAEEIEQTAYLHGFPCHLSAEYQEDGDGTSGYVGTNDSQHCAGALIMYLKEQEGEPWPAIMYDQDVINAGGTEKLIEKLWKQVDLEAPVYDSSHIFIKDNPGK